MNYDVNSKDDSAADDDDGNYDDDDDSESINKEYDNKHQDHH